MWWSWRLIFHQRSSSPAMDLPQRKQEAISVNLSLTKQKIAESRRQVTGTIQTINQYSFTKLMVMVGMSIIVLVRRRKAGWRGPTLFHLLDGKFLWNRRRSNLKHHHWRNGTKLWQRDHHIERKTSWEGSRGPGSLQKAEHDLARTSCVQAIKWTLFVRWLGLVITGLLVQSWEALGN